MAIICIRVQDIGPRFKWKSDISNFHSQSDFQILTSIRIRSYVIRPNKKVVRMLIFGRISFKSNIPKKDEIVDINIFLC